VGGDQRDAERIKLSSKGKNRRGGYQKLKESGRTKDVEGGTAHSTKEKK